MDNVFIVILNLNKPDLTIECLESIKELSINNFKLSIVLVDNGSTHESLERLKKYLGNDPKCKLIVNGCNLGFAGGNNIGIRYALKMKADFIILLNNDTSVDKNLVIGFLETFQENPNSGVISPKIYFAKGFEFHKERYKDNELGKVIWYAGGDVDWDNVYGSNHGVDEVDRGQFEKVGKVDFATGACMFLKASVLKKTGSLDEKYFVYFEDTDLSQRMKLAGFDVLYSPKGIIWHKVAQSSAIGGNLNDYFTTRNRLLFGLKYAPLRSKIALIRESIKLLINGRRWQRIGVKDFYLRKFGKGSWIDK